MLAGLGQSARGGADVLAPGRVVCVTSAKHRLVHAPAMVLRGSKGEGTGSSPRSSPSSQTLYLLALHGRDDEMPPALETEPVPEVVVSGPLGAAGGARMRSVGPGKRGGPARKADSRSSEPSTPTLAEPLYVNEGYNVDGRCVRVLCVPVDCLQMLSRTKLKVDVRAILRGNRAALASAARQIMVRSVPALPPESTGGGELGAHWPAECPRAPVLTAGLVCACACAYARSPALAQQCAEDKELVALDPAKDLRVVEMQLAAEWQQVSSKRASLSQSKCHECPRRAAQFAEAAPRVRLEATLAHLRDLGSDDSLALLPEYHHRLSVLKRLGYVDEASTVQVKGRVASSINTCDELLLTEMIFENVFADLDPEEVVAVLSALVFEVCARRAA